MLSIVFLILLSVGYSIQQCTNGSLRLSSQQYGAVDVCLDGIWGSICSDFWDNNDASVICRQLGYSPYGALGPSAVQTPSSAPSHNIIDLNCTGQESNILECPFNGLIGQYSCSNSRDANVYCQDSNLVTYSNCTDGKMRLVNGSNQYQGRVEVCINNAWGTVCSLSWSSTDAKVVCRHAGAQLLGFSYGRATSLGFGEGQGPILLGYLYCSGQEKSLVDCDQNYHSANSATACKQHRNDAAVICEAHCVNDTVRLKGGSYTYGRVEICINEIWSTICSDNWNYEDVSVVCNQLGYSPYGAIPASGYYTESTWPVGIVNLNCTGSENSIFHCTYNQTGSCLPSRDASVICQNVTVEPINCETGDIRLVEGSIESEGRLEVCINQLWGTVCSRNWDYRDTRVACKQLGHQELGGVKYSSSVYGRGTGPILLGYMYCTGSEDSLFKCSRNIFSVSTGSCSNHYYDIGLKCEPRCVNDTVRLKGGSYTYGRVEICINEIWSTICSDNWNYEDASVVCNQLGYSPYGAIPASGYYTESTWPVGIVNLNCTGSENSIFHCTYNQTGSCSPSRDASVICQNVTVEPINCETGDIRLVEGSIESEGRLEVCINQLWGTVCSRNWDYRDTRVACKQLGHQELGGVQYSSSVYGRGTGPILLGYMYCTGSEDSLFKCSRSVFSVSTGSCSDHKYDIGLKCEPICEHGTVRLQGGTTSSTGRVEVCINGTWGTVCSDLWDNIDASVICSQLGYSSYGAVAVTGYYSTSIWSHHVIDLNCTGSEGELLNCSYNRPSDGTCSSSQDATAICQSNFTQKANCTDGDIRLEGGQTEYEGRVEICINKAWGTICGYRRYSRWTYYPYWESSDSNVVCNQLGHMELGSTPYRTAGQFGQGTGPIFLSGLNCQGNEQTLLSCPYKLIHSSSCSHSYDVGVKCEAKCANGTVRLYSESGSYFRRYGRVQICINNAWGTICDNFWDEQDASVVCRMLGYSPYGASALTNTFTEGVWYMHIKDLNCTGTELSIWDCPMNGLSSSSCSHYDDASVVCQLPNVVSSNCTTNEVRLTGGSNQYEGRVEYCVNGVWQSICDYSWDDVDAYTVCRQLGYQGGSSMHNSYFGVGMAPVYIYYFSCQYNSPNMSSCTQYRYSSRAYCNNYQEAGVICEAPCSDHSVDLFGFSLGIVRMCVNGSWSKVCGVGNTILDNELASVACYSAGFSKHGAKSYQGYWTGRKYPFNFFNMRCYGNESSLHECDYDTTGTCSLYYRALTVSCQIRSIWTQVNCTDGDIKLYEGENSNKGILLICINRVWTKICQDYYYWSRSNTNVVCRQLGYTVYENTYRTVTYPHAFPTIYESFDCRGSESSLSSCSSSFYYSNSLYCYRTVEITCAERCASGNIQLHGSHYYGRVEVCVGGIWGTICRDSFWDNSDASVICRQLGFSPYGAIAVPFNWHSDTNSFAFVGGLNCTGNELHILNCPFNSTVSSCPSNNDANVICPIQGSTYSNCTDGDIRLLNGSTKYEGRVEICINNAWGTITHWDSNTAQTVCNQLGYTGSGAVTLTNAYFGKGNGPVLLTYVYCSTPKDFLMNCSIRYTYDVNIRRSRYYAIGVRCQSYCEHGSIRLAGSSDPLQGRVEVCVNSTWGSICNDYWHNNDASVVCRQLGFPSEGAVAHSLNYYGTSPSFHIIDLNCNGSEDTILNCSHNNITQHSCRWYEDAYVQCQIPDTTDNCTNGAIRLVKGSTKYEGLVEICADGSWGYICQYGWGQTDAMVTCRQLGYTKIGAKTSFSFGKGAGHVHFSRFSCSGDEKSLLNCTQYTSSCYYSDHAGVVCQAPCTDGEVRLQGDRRYNSFGRVEVCIGDTWGTICDDYWDSNDASVVCKQLGFSPYGAVAKTSFYTESVLPHVIFNMSCNGNEDSIFNCTYSTELPSESNCYSFEDASVICQDISVPHSNCTDYDVKLVGGVTGNEGKVLMCLNGVWGALCDDNFDETDAGVVCYSAGYSKRGYTYLAHFPDSSNEILLATNIYCTTTDEKIQDCSISHYTPPSSCDVLDIVAVRCHNCTDGDVRIVPYNSVSNTVGRVEVCHDSSWGTICSDFFDHSDAQVICRQLGYYAIGSVYIGPFNDYLHYHHIIDINCTGSESNIQDCPSNNLTNYYCPSYRDAGVSCNAASLSEYANCTDGEIRLAGGTEMSGRVEICYNRVWYGVCSDNYNRYYVPATICKELNYSSQGAVGKIIKEYSLLPLLPFEFYCYYDRNRESLWDCSRSFIQCFNGPYLYTGVTCQAKCNDWEARLYTSSSYNNVGAVEVCIDGEWATVCHTDFDVSDAAVVCSQLGYMPYGAIVLPKYYYTHSRSVYISDLNCTGSERNIQNCSYTLPKKESCLNAALLCQRTNGSVDVTCIDGNVRLVGGISDFEGSVEICYNKFWGSVCDNSWNTVDANIVCKQLGHQPSGARVFSRSYFGHGISEAHIMTNVHCYMSANTLLDCSYSFSADTTCGDMDKAGVVCLGSCEAGNVRLRDSNIESAGRVEICIQSVWTSVCDQSWDLKDAQVACRELGYSPYGAMPTYSCYTEGQLSFGITSINCTGSEENLLNCSHSNPVLYNCLSHNDAGLICQNNVQKSNCSDGAVRLVGGSGPHEGRLEVCVNEAWGTVCSNGWSNTDSNVICNQLGHLPLGGRYKNFGRGTNVPILMSNLQCIGSESSLLECNQQACFVTSCSHNSDVGIICETPCVDGSIRLGDRAVLRGRVEVCYNGSWVTICSHSWTVQEATVICSQLGYSRHGAIAVSNAFINNEWPTGVYNLNCTGNESSLFNCQFSTTGNCDQSNDASVFCMPNTTQYSNCSDGDVRLVGGSTINEGNAQICYRNAWGSICDDYWGTSDSNVVCRQLGLQPYGSSAYHFNRYGVYSPFVYGHFYCSGIEETLLNCSISSVNSLLTCQSSEIAGVKCIGTCTDGKVHIRGSYNARIGRVDVCVNGTWVTICDENWDDNDTAVICHQLGYSSYGAMAAYGNIIFDSYPTRVYGVNCTGSEKKIFDCPMHLVSSDVSYSSCSQNDAGVICQSSQTLVSNCISGSARLRGGSTSNQGRVEICINNVWGTVCDDGWGELDGNVVCKQLGYQSVGSRPKYRSSYGSSSLPIMLANLACTGNEETLLECNRNSYSILNCHGYELAGVKCEELCTDGEVRIVGSSNQIGRVEVCVNQTWGTVCDTAWNNKAASVVCRQLGFSPYGAIAASNEFSDLLLPTHIDSVNCIGFEESVFNCTINYQGTTSCGSRSDAGVICQDISITPSNCDHGEMRLVNGPTHTEGRVEICFNGVWGTLCDDGWNTVDANVVCDQLGYYPSGAKARYGSFYGSGSGPIFLSNLHCTGNELSILECNRDIYSVRNCHHYEDAGVKCIGTFPVYTSRSVGSMLGGEIITITGPVFEPDDNITCTFGDIETIGGFLTKDKCLCVTPPVENDGIVQLNLKITRKGTATLNGGTKFRFVLPFDMEDSTSPVVSGGDDDDAYSVGTGNRVNVTWNEYALTGGLLSGYTVFLNIKMTLYNTDTDSWEESHTLASDVPASDERAEVVIPEYPQIDETTLRLSQISVSLSKITSTRQKRLALILIGLARSIMRYVWKKVKEEVIETAAEEYIEARRSAALRLACEAWYKHDRGVNNRQLPPCPCKKSQARHDDRYTKENLLQGIGSISVLKRDKAKGGCYRQSSVGSYSPSQQCCYGGNGNLLTGTGGGSAYSVYPNNWKSLLGHFINDVVPHYLCCSGKYFSGCQDRYYDKRPNDNGEDYPQRPPPARTFGDPHLVSLDGTQYTFNGHGEFILVQSIDGSLMIQARMTEPSSSSDSNETLASTGTVITAIVAKHDESDTVQFEVVNNQLIALVNGEEIDFTELTEQHFKNLTILDKGNRTLLATIASGTTITVTERINMLADVSVTLSDEYYGRTIGLLGQYNGKSEDDLLSRNSNTTTLTNATTEEIHYQFGLTWIIANPLESLFVYSDTGSWNTFYRPDYKPIFEPQFNNTALEEKAQEICGDDKLCLFDIAATGDVNIGQATKETGQDLATITELLKPIVCDFPCVHGACVENNTCFCSEGYDGAMCNDTIIQECNENICLNGAVCQIVAGDYLCICSKGYTGPNCGTEIIASSAVPTPSDSPSANKPGLAIGDIAMMIGFGIFGIFVLVILVVACCLFLIRRVWIKKSESQLSHEADVHEMITHNKNK